MHLSFAPKKNIFVVWDVNEVFVFVDVFGRTLQFETHLPGNISYESIYIPEGFKIYN